VEIDMDINDDYFKACRKGDMEKIKAGTTESFFDNYYQLRLAVNNACIGKQLEVVKYLFNSIPEDRKVYSTYHCNFENFGASIFECCKNGSIDILDFFRDQMNGITNLHHFETCARTAYANGQLEVVKHLLTSSEGEYFISQKKYYNTIFSTDYPKGNDVAKYLLSNEKFNQHIKMVSLLERAYQSKNVELVEYMIFDLDIQYSKKVKRAVQFFKSEGLDIPHLFANRDKIKLAQALELELTNDKEKSKRLKI
jgi:hypothetical protein